MSLIRSGLPYSTLPNTKTPYYPQLAERDCGATCLRMVAEHYGVRASLAKLREVTKTTDTGADLGGIELGARAFGFDTLAAELPYDELAAGDLLPAILHWDRDHFVVVANADQYSATILDPAAGSRRLNREDFEAHRFGPGRSRAGLVIRPTEAMLATPTESTEPAAIHVSADSAPAVATESTAPATASVANDEPPSTKTSPLSWHQKLWLIASMVSFFVLLGIGCYVLHTVLTQAVDLQFREGWARFLGSLLTVSAAVAMSYYLTYRFSIQYATLKAGEAAESQAKFAAIPGVSAGLDHERQAIGLVSDINAIRNWRAYELPEVVLASSICLVSVIGLIAAVPAMGLSLLVTLAAALGVSLTLRRRSAANRTTASEAAMQQALAEREYTALAPVAGQLGGNAWLEDRLYLSRQQADGAYIRVASEYGASRQLVAWILVVGVVLTASLGCYRLGFDELQVGELTWALLLVAGAAYMLPQAIVSWNKWAELTPSRMRLEELMASAQAMSTNVSGDSSAVNEQAGALLLGWCREGAEPQEVELLLPSHIAFVGGDKHLRAELLASMLPTPHVQRDDLAVRIVSQSPEAVRALADAILIKSEDALADGSIAENIALSSQADPDKLALAVQVSGLAYADLPQGLDTRVGTAGEALSHDVKLRTLIARAVYADVSGIILDGVTDTIGAYAEGTLLDALVGWGSNKTIIISAARAGAAFGFDQIVHVEAGEIVGQGNHKQLLSDRGAYYYQTLATKPSPS